MMAGTPIFNRRQALVLGVSLVAAPAIVRAATSPVLVELFTSQGCSSCPPADELIGRLARRDDLLVATLNVDYWDYLGWRDTLGRAEYSQRQYDYAKTRGDGEVYTPQVVVNGRHHAVGSRLADVEAAIAKAQRDPADIPLTIKSTRTEVTIDIAQGSSPEDSTLWLMAIVPNVTQTIERGENAGKSVTYHNVARALVPAGMWKGDAARLSLMKEALMPEGSKACFAVLQQDKTGPVLGLARWNYTEW